MLAPKMPPMTEAEYEIWHRQQEDRYEYVDGSPQLKFADWDGPKLMTGATQAHNVVGGNCYFLLREVLKGKPCRAYISDGKVVTAKGNHRFPDVTVDCGPYRPAASELAQPVVVFEVLSTSTHWIDNTRKLEDYQSIASIQHIVFLAQDEARGRCWSRGDGWTVADFEGMDAEIQLPALQTTLRLSAVYEAAFAQ